MNFIGYWFNLLKEQGEDINLEYCFWDPPVAEQSKLETVGHDVMDGLALAEHILINHLNTKPSVAQMKLEYHCPSFFYVLKDALKFHLFRSQRPVPWKARLPYDKSNVSSQLYRTEIVLPSGQSTALLDQLKQQRISLNGFLSFHFDRAIRKIFLVDHENYATTYMLPVNLRGGHPDLTGGNQAAYIDLEIGPHETPETIKSQLHQKLTTFRPWSVYWTAIWVAKYAPGLARKWVKQHFEVRPPPVVGSISNLGQWNSDHPQTDKLPLIWGTVSWVRPLALLFYRWDGRLVVTLKGHPSLIQSDRQLSQLRADIFSKIKQLTSSTLGHSL